MLQWDDGTIAHYTRHTFDNRATQRNSCGSMTSADGITMAYCSSSKQRLSTAALCQVPLLGSHSQRGAGPEAFIQLERPRERPTSASTVLCPLGHWTLDFLASDAQSSCRSGRGDDSLAVNGDSEPAGHGPDDAGGIPGPSDVAVTSLPVSFACGSGSRVVPFSLLCDHRRDCQDNSDEDFCVFPRCSVYTQFACTSLQVRRR